jgi:hypothetical protein
MVMSLIGEIVGREIGKYLDSDKNTINLQVECTDIDDLRDVQLMQHGGRDYNPANGSQVLVIPISSSWLLGIAVDDGIEPEGDEGDHEVYATDSEGVKTARVKCCADGTVELNGTADHLVRYSELEATFNQLRDDFNALVQAFNAHPHITTATVGASATVGTIAPTTLTADPSTADISTAKVDEVKVP